MVKVVIEGDPQAWGKRFTQLVCEAWYRKEGRRSPPPPGAREGEQEQKEAEAS